MQIFEDKTTVLANGLRDTGALPNRIAMWFEVQQPRYLDRLTKPERAWVDGQRTYRKAGRTTWSSKEETMLSNIWVQRILPTKRGGSA